MPTTIDRTAAPAGSATTPGRQYRRRQWLGRSYRLPPQRSLNIVVEHADDCIIVREVFIGIYGTGKDVVAAFEDFKNAVAQHRDVLERQEALSPDLSHQLAYLRDRLHQ